MSTRIVKNSASEVVAFATQSLVAAARENIAASGSFSLALAGGSTPRALYEMLASDDFRGQLEWDKIHIFFGDERAVPPDDDLSNFKMAQSALLSKVPLPLENIHRMQAERADLEAAARDYERELSTHAPLNLVLLGMGGDGHTASLFPHSPALEETERLCVATPVASLEPHVRRLTLTFTAINAARRVWILVVGADKATRLQSVLEGERDVASTPIQGVQPETGELLWLLDEAAAARLTGN